MVRLFGFAACVVLIGLLPCCTPAHSPDEPASMGGTGVEAPAPPPAPGPAAETTAETEPEAELAEESPADALTLSHRLDPGACAPGGELEVVVDMNYVGDDPITALAIRQVVPEGWTFIEVTSGIIPAVTPRPDATGTLDFVWITTPDWPNNFSYALRVPEDADGAVSLTGQGIYRASGPELRTTPVSVEVPVEAAP